MRNVWLCILFTESFIKDAKEVVGLLLKDWHLSSEFIMPISANAHLQAL